MESAPPPPSAPAAAASTAPPDPAAGQADEAPLICAACGEPTTTELSRQRGARGLKVWDLACSAAWRAYQQKFKKHSALKVAWEAKTAAQKQEWFREQKSLHQLAKRRRFENMQVQEVSFHEKKADERDLLDWVPCEEWAIRERLINPAITQAEVTKKWNSIVMDPGAQKKFHPKFGHCLPIFKGIREYNGQSQGYRQQHLSGTAVKDIASMENLQQGLNQTMALANAQFSTTAALPARSDELQKALAPAHLAQGVVEGKGRNMFFDQLVYEELQDVEANEALREQAFQADLKAAQEFAKQQGFDTESTQEKKGGNNGAHIITAQILVKTTLAKLTAAQETCEATTAHSVTFLEREVDDEDEKEAMQTLIDALKLAQENNLPAAQRVITRLQGLKVKEQAEKDFEGLKKTVKECAEEHRTALKDWKKTIVSVEKSMKKSGYGAQVSKKLEKNEGESAEMMPGIFLHNCTLVGKSEVRCTDKVGELSGADGVAARIELDDKEESTKHIIGFAQVKGVIKKCWQHIDDGEGKAYATSLFHTPKQANEITDYLKHTGMEDEAFSDLALHPRDMSWGSSIFGVQAWTCTSSYNYQGVSPFGVNEGRMVLSGSIVIGGAPLEKVPGASYADKIKHMQTASGQDLDRLVQSGGWACRVAGGEVVLVPVGHIVVIAPTSAKVEGISWGFIGPSDEPAVLKVCAALLDTYPSLRNSAYKNWMDMLSARVSEHAHQ